MKNYIYYIYNHKTPSVWLITTITTVALWDWAPSCTWTLFCHGCVKEKMFLSNLTTELSEHSWAKLSPGLQSRCHLVHYISDHGPESDPGQHNISNHATLHWHNSRDFLKSFSDLPASPNYFITAFGRLSCFSGHLSGPELGSNALMLRFLLAVLWGTSLLLFHYPLRPRKQRPRDLHPGRSSAKEGWCWQLCMPQPQPGHQAQRGPPPSLLLFSVVFS